MQLEQALAIVKAAGYRVSKPKAKVVAKALNAVGKPYGANYDPNYRMKYRTPRLSRTQSVGIGIQPAQWAEMCKLAQAAWNQREAAELKAAA